MSKLGKAIGIIIGGILSLPFILLGVAIGVMLMSARVVVRAGEKKSPVAKSVGAKMQDTGEVDIAAPINWNEVPIGRMDKGGTG